MYNVTSHANKRFSEYLEYEKSSVELNWITPESMITANDILNISADSKDTATAIYRAYCYGYLVAAMIERKEHPEPINAPINRQAVTAYILWENRLTKQIKPMRRVFNSASWEEKDGNITVRLINERGLSYVPFEIWFNMSEDEIAGHWTIDPGKPPLIVNHDTAHEFDWGISKDIVTAENMFMRDTPGVVRARKADMNMSGCFSDRHIILRACR